MRVVGIDYASTGYSAIAVAVDRQPVSATAWKPPKMRTNIGRLRAQERWLTAKLTMLKPDLVVVIELAVFHNKKTIRALAHHESLCLLVSSKKSPTVIQRTDVQARAVVFAGIGDGGRISKDDAWASRHLAFPGFDFGRKDAGGDDKMDAMTAAVAGPDLIQSRS